jgi:hypothetical protein
MYIELVKTIDFPNAANPAVYEDISPQCIEITDGRSKPIRRAVNAATATIQDVCVHHRCAPDLLTVTRDFHIPKR